MDGEIWRDIIGYEGLYQVSNFGRVKSLSRRKHSNLVNVKVLITKTRILKPSITKYGYIRIALSNFGVKKYHVHTLMARAFIPNPENKPEVNHKNGLKSDNRLDNLEWVTRVENARHAWDNGLIFIGMNGAEKPVYQYDKNGIFIRKWRSAQEAGRSGYSSSSICQCCNGVLTSSYNYIWSYSELDKSSFKAHKIRTYIGKIASYDDFGNLIKVYKSTGEAKLDGYNACNLLINLKKGRKYRGYFWKKL